MLTRARTLVALSTALSSFAAWPALASPPMSPTPPLTPAGSAPSVAPTSATIAPSLSPNRFGAHAALTFTISYAGGQAGVPTPVRRSVLRFPAGMSIQIPRLGSCSPSRLRARGPSGCPARSRLGRGHALLEARAGSQLISEHVTLFAFLGPLRKKLEPTVEILGEGRTPLLERMVLTGTVLPDDPPYGEQLVMPIPPIPTLPYLPEASIVTFSLTVGAIRPRSALTGNSVRVPSSCPAGGFPFAAQFTYSNGAAGSALARTPCPS